MDEQGTDHGQAPVEKKKGKGPLIGIVVAAVLVVGAGAAGAVMGPKFFRLCLPIGSFRGDRFREEFGPHHGTGGACTHDEYSSDDDANEGTLTLLLLHRGLTVISALFVHDPHLFWS